MTNRTDSWQSENCRSFCLALLPMGFTQPARSPEPLVRSYRTVSPLPPARPCGPADRRFAFCCTCPILADGGRYPPSCPVEPGLSSPPKLTQRTPGHLQTATHSLMTFDTKEGQGARLSPDCFERNRAIRPPGRSTANHNRFFASVSRSCQGRVYRAVV